jgi:hypothetical protein
MDLSKPALRPARAASSVLTARSPIPVPRSPAEPQSGTILLTERLDLAQNKLNEVIDLIDEIDEPDPDQVLKAKGDSKIGDLTASELASLIEAAVGRALRGGKG